MNFKKIATTIELLAITSVMSVGFSAWAIVETEFPTVTATIETENVINNNDYLEIKNIIFSDYDSMGFYEDFKYVDAPTTIGGDGRTLVGKLEISVDIFVLKYYSSGYISNTQSLVFEFGLSSTVGSSSPANIFAKCSNIEMTYKYNGVKENEDGTTAEEEKSGTVIENAVGSDYLDSSARKLNLSTSVSLNSYEKAKETLSFKFVYAFTIIDSNYTNFYNSITSMKGLPLVFQIELTGGN